MNNEDKDLIFSPHPDQYFDQRSEKELIDSIQARVAELLETDPELLFSHLYRLDIDEKRIQLIMHKSSSTKIIDNLALEIYHRQCERIKTKANIKVPPLEPGWEW
ncbi:MAG: hypothetical protein WBB26_07840 [Saprospiraceae bacterium]|nr:hypothetical protein [Saprospiraceae bacterium]